MHFDWTINVGNLIAAFTFLVLAAIAWTDLRWRVKNLESSRTENLEWRKEHMIDADSRDQIIIRMDKLLERIETLIEERGGGRRAFIRSDNPPPYHGPERRGKS